MSQLGLDSLQNPDVLPYAAPAICDGSPASPQADQHALALTYYHLRTARSAGDCDDFGSITASEAAVLRRSTSSDPYPTCVAMLQALQNAVAATRIVDENVQFSVYRPKVMAPEQWYKLLAFAHLSELEDEREPARQDEEDPIVVVQREAKRRLGAG